MRELITVGASFKSTFFVSGKKPFGLFYFGVVQVTSIVKRKIRATHCSIFHLTMLVPYETVFYVVHTTTGHRN